MKTGLAALAASLLLAASSAVVVAGPSKAVKSPLRHVYYGDLHLHTTYSFDAWSLMGTTTTPDQAYKFARGETVTINGVKARRTWPLDFLAVTDHSENMGVMNQLDDPNTDFAKSALGEEILKNKKAAFYILYRAINKGENLKAMHAAEAMKSVWIREKAAANANYEPGKFTTFIAYEWSSMADGLYNLHRNVIFEGPDAPLPFSSTQSRHPEDLWSYLEQARRHGYKVIAIPHNPNVSNGLMFDWNNSDGKPIDEVYAQRRAMNEPLVEIVQNKGQSETNPELSPNDEMANFEIFDRILVQPDMKSKSNGSYVRQAWGRGLVIQNRVGTNPFKMGVVGATDIHNGLSTSDENAMAGGPYGIDPNTMVPTAEVAKHRLDLEPTPALIDVAAAREHRQPTNEKVATFSSGGLTGVWAEHNTRASIFAALKRKETFATSGPRLQVRFFGSWDVPANLMKQKNWIATAYADGVPMGGDLPARPKKAQAPKFAVWAVKDPDSGNLDRIQIIKVWVEGGKYKEKVFDVAASGERKVDPTTGHLPPVGNTVDLKTATFKNTIGATQLATVWQDPEFKPDEAAVYYARVIQIPTPRWTTILAVKRHLPLTPDAPATIQERAWSSPIWYTPETHT